jgi:hypothetical protein
VFFKPAGFIGFHTVTDNSGSAGGTNHRDGVEARAGWQEANLETRPKWGFSEGGFSGALAGGNDDNGEVDR